MARSLSTNRASQNRKTSAKPESLAERASFLAQQGRYDEALQKVAEAMRLAPNNPWFSLQLADIYKAQRRIEPAIEAMKHAVELDPTNCRANELLLRTLLDLGRYDEAIAGSYRLLGCSPRSVLARDVLAIAYLESGRIDKALEVVDQLIRIDPTNAAHYFKKGILLRQKGFFAEAMDFFCRVLDMDAEDELAEEAVNAITELDSYQIKQILTLAEEDPVFRAKFSLDREAAVEEKGFHLSPVGIRALRSIDISRLERNVWSPLYH
ncbi:MAG: tetratricopeptide repeat protein [Armatimonadota bacterium]|nr:tetratricopeptide repeat protein [Armatimonadota bacterium]